MANIFTKRGQEAKESMEQSGGVDLKEVYIRLKDGESVRVRVLSPIDYVEYLAVGDFNLGIFTQPSLVPLGKPDAFAEAKAIADELAGDDKDHELFPFTRLYGKKRYVFAFADLDTGKLRVWDASKKQAKAVIASIEKYKEDIGDIAFDFSRTGNKLETVYALDPILRLKGDDVEKFENLGELEVADELFNQVLIARTYEQQVEILEKAGFPVEEYFDVTATEEEAPPEEPTEEELPF